MSALLDALRERTPPPPGSRADPFRLLVSMIEHDPFVGRLVTGRVASGEVKVGDRVKALTAAAAGGAARETGRVTKLFTSRGGVRHPLDRAAAGDVVSVAGLSGATVTDTVCDAAVSDPLPATPVDPPTLRMTFGVNDSSLGGREGKSLTGRQIWDRLVAEAETNVALRVLQVADGGGDRFEVQGRGELHLGVLIETMRREEFELSISPPAVLFRQCAPTGRRPVILSVSPSYGPFEGGTLLSVSAEELDPAARLFVGGVELVDVVVDPDAGIASGVTPPAAVAVQGPADVVVRNPGGLRAATHKTAEPSHQLFAKTKRRLNDSSRLRLKSRLHTILSVRDSQPRLQDRDRSLQLQTRAFSADCCRSI